MVEINYDNYSLDNQFWINKNDQGFTTKFTQVYLRWQEEMGQTQKLNGKLN